MKDVPKVRVPIVCGADSTCPTYATDGAAGVDLRSTISFSLKPMERRLVPTGLRIALPHGYEAQIRPRSGLAIQHGLSMVNAPGTIDSDYRGEIQVILINFGENVVELNKGDRIAQMVVCPVVQAEFLAVENLDETDRGQQGFGSTGRI